MELEDFFARHPRAALAFSGGTDSAYLLYAARQCGCDIRPYFLKTVFQPAFELADARRLCGQMGIALTVLEEDILAGREVAANGAERCYHCKKALFTRLRDAAQKDGYSVLLDGTNASDDSGDRPGMRALAELSVRSPLRECGLTKAEVRARSEKAGLFTAQKPAYACLATRIPAGTAITAQALAQVEASENFLFSLGLRDLRVRVEGNTARIQLPRPQFARLIEHADEVRAEFGKYFESAVLDLAPRKET